MFSLLVSLLVFAAIAAAYLAVITVLSYVLVHLSLIIFVPLVNLLERVSKDWFTGMLVDLLGICSPVILIYLILLAWMPEIFGIIGLVLLGVGIVLSIIVALMHWGEPYKPD